MKRTIVLSTISLHKMAGGLERNFVRVANHFSAQGHDVRLLTFDMPEAESFFPLHAGITWHKTGRTRPHGKISFAERLRLFQRMRIALKTHNPRPVIIIAFHHGILLRLFIAGAFLRKKLVCSERNSLTIYNHIRLSQWNLNFLMLALCKAITVQFEAYRHDYPSWLRKKIICIPNLVEPALSQAQTIKPDAQGRYRILAVGRLCAQKNYDYLIETFGALTETFPKWDLYIIGNGDLEPHLRHKIQHMNLESRIFLPGVAAPEAMHAWYASSHLYCMPSQWEGFPNALAEALAHGLPSVGFEGCAGVRDLIADGKNGLLAPGHGDVQSLHAALSRFMTDEHLRAEMSGNAVESVKPYTAGRIFSLWDQLTERL